MCVIISNRCVCTQYFHQIMFPLVNVLENIPKMVLRRKAMNIFVFIVISFWTWTKPTFLSECSPSILRGSPSHTVGALLGGILTAVS